MAEYYCSSVSWHIIGEMDKLPAAQWTAVLQLAQLYTIPVPMSTRSNIFNIQQIQIYIELVANFGYLLF